MIITGVTGVEKEPRAPRETPPKTVYPALVYAGTLRRNVERSIEARKQIVTEAYQRVRDLAKERASLKLRLMSIGGDLRQAEEQYFQRLERYQTHCELLIEAGLLDKSRMDIVKSHRRVVKP